jgi:hypothetical protein
MHGHRCLPWICPAMPEGHLHAPQQRQGTKGGASTKAGGENDAKDRLNKASPADPRSGRRGPGPWRSPAHGVDTLPLQNRPACSKENNERVRSAVVAKNEKPGGVVVDLSRARVTQRVGRPVSPLSAGRGFAPPAVAFPAVRRAEDRCRSARPTMRRRGRSLAERAGAESRH